MILHLLLSCKTDDPTSSCTPTLSLDGQTLTAESECGSLSLDPDVFGEGELTVTLSLEGESLVPTITAGPQGGTFTALAMSGGVYVRALYGVRESACKRVLKTPSDGPQVTVTVTRRLAKTHPRSPA